MPKNFYGALLVIDGTSYIFDFYEKEIKEYARNRKFKKWENKWIGTMPIDELGVLGISLHKMTKIIKYRRGIKDE